MKKLVVYIHGKGGSANESEHYKSIFRDCDVLGLDYKSQTPWDARVEFCDFFDDMREKYNFVTVIANSIGAFFAMNALSARHVDCAFFISPIVDMEKLILNMMALSNITENDLREKQEITTSFGENLSWKYLSYVREQPIIWKIPTHILYGENDALTSHEIIFGFADKIGASLTVMKGGEHWFHTDAQMKFLDEWLKKCEQI